MPKTIKAPAHLPALLALSGGGALLLGAMTAAPAAAHDSLIGSTPEADTVLDESPEEVVLEFSGEGLTTGESIPNTIWVTDEDGERWEGETQANGPTMRTELDEPLPNGEYEVLYRAVYSDGHSEELGFSFEVDAAEVEDEPGAAEDEIQDEDGAAAEDPATEAAEESEAAEEPTAEESSAEETSAEEPTDEVTSGEEPAGAVEDENQFPVGLVVGIGAGVLVLIVVALLLVRRKVTQNDQG